MEFHLGYSKIEFLDRCLQELRVSFPSIDLQLLNVELAGCKCFVLHNVANLCHIFRYNGTLSSSDCSQWYKLFFPFFDRHHDHANSSSFERHFRGGISHIWCTFSETQTFRRMSCTFSQFSAYSKCLHLYVMT